jgi:predicted phage tail protein
MLRKIKLYGRLAKFIGKRVLHADVASTAEAVRFLLANWPQLEGHMSNQHYRVSVGDYELTEDELGHPIGQQEIKFVPVVSGAGATGRIIAGIALIAVALLFAPGAALAGSLLTIGAQAVPVIIGIGVSLTIGGVAELLTPTPKVPQGADTQDDPRKSYSFSSIQNTSRQGTPVPIVYGRCIVGSVVISGGIDTVQVVG